VSGGHRRIGRVHWALAAALSVAMAAGGGAGCSVLQAPESGFILTIEDPSGRLGPPPWKAAIFNPYFGAEEQLAFRFNGSVSPGRPFPILSRHREDHWQMSDPLSEVEDLQFGLVLPALRADGYWLARVPREGAGSGSTGSARFCAWRQLVPVADSETLAISVRERDGEGVQYETTVRIPAAPLDRGQ
jgi:hypothetical protein